MAAPSIAELRAATQPASIFARNSGEHWAGRLYMRRLSPYLTRRLIPLPITPNGVTWLMIAVGLAAAAVLTLPGWWPPVVVVLLIQCQLLLDCSDGELARWRGVSSPAGIYLDRGSTLRRRPSLRLRSMNASSCGRRRSLNSTSACWSFCRIRAIRSSSDSAIGVTPGVQSAGAVRHCNMKALESDRPAVP